MGFNFDEIIERKNTNSVKHDGLSSFMNIDDAIPMWVADMDFKSPPCIVNAMKKRLEHEVFGYTFRSDSFFNSIINWMQKRHGWTIQKNWISFSPGVVAGFTIAIEQFSQPGDKIIVQPPVYFPFFQSINDTGRETVYNPLKLENGRCTIDLEDLKAKIDPTVKLLLLSNPHNPGGSVWTKVELQAIHEICLENNILVISDEIHADVVYKPARHIPFASLSGEAAMNSLTVMSHSKTFNVAGLTTSFVISKNQELLEKYNKGLHIPHLHMGNIFGNEALMAAYNEGEPWLEELLNYLTGNVNFVANYLENHLPQLKLIKPESTFLLWIDCRALNLTGKEIGELFLKKAKVAINEGSMFGPGGEGFVRLNIGCSRITLKKALDQIKEAIDNL